LRRLRGGVIREFSMVVQRIFSLVLLLVCIGLAMMAWPYQAPFSYEPVGPRAFPLLMLALMGISLLYMTIRPTPIVHSAPCCYWYSRACSNPWVLCSAAF
jgi:hypothetical protein